MPEKISAADYNAFNPVVRANPYPYYAALRDESPIHRMIPGAPLFAVSRHADVQHVLHRPEQFSSTAFQALFQGGLSLSPNSGALAGHRLLASPMMISVDPPHHQRLRGLVNRGFTPRRIAALEPRLREIAERFFEDVRETGKMDLVRDLSVPFPVTVIAELLGVEPELRHKFKHWSDSTVIGLSGISQDFSKEEVRKSADEMADYFERVAAERRANPKDDLISVLVTADDGDALSAGEVLSFVFLLLVAGNETTTNLIGNAMHALLRHPAQMKEVAENPELIPQMLEEALRYDSPIQSLPRQATADVELPSGAVKKDTFLMTLFASANRDSNYFPNADQFDIHRKPQGHLAFGHGIHFCLGASLARLEAKVAFETLFENARNFQLDGKIAMLDSLALRGPKSVPLAFESA
ncbi:MAG: cytochrome P450 [Deltaproteobacteria bacterium]|jgi:cytochrome P450|nr:cytochrome P450 [Deltaproteobacteria bacterium]